MASTTNNSSSSVFQFRYYGAKNPKNVPSDDMPWIGASSDGTEAFDLLSSQGISAIKIGIQTLPGVKFYLNNTGQNEIIIDHTGVYELDLRNTTTTISSLFFDPISLARIEEIDNASIIVDVLSNSMS